MQPRPTGHGPTEPPGAAEWPVRFFLEDRSESASRPAPGAGSVSRLGAARAALREAERAEWEERRRLAFAPVDGLTAAHAALLQARQAQTRAAVAQIEDLRRRAAWLCQAIAQGEAAVAAQQRVVDKLRRELAEIGE